LSRRKATLPGIALLAMLLAVGLFTMVGKGHTPSRHSAAAPPRHATRTSKTVVHHAKPAPYVAPTVVTIPLTGGSTTLSSTGPGALPQTYQLPSSSTAAFRTEMEALWQGIKSDSLAAALPAFFPEAAYLQVKTVASPRMDYLNRLLVEFQLDVDAAHRLLGQDAPSATLVGVSVPTGQAGWVFPGYCLNRVGYFQVSGSRLVYEVNGQIRSFIIASLISWRGVWYVVHLGAISRTDETGLVDDPTIGSGTFGPPEGC